MPRRKRMRKVVAPPGFRGYKPYGNRHGRKEHVDLHYEEYEAIKLADYDLAFQEQHLPGYMKAQGEKLPGPWSKPAKSDPCLEMPAWIIHGSYVMHVIPGSIFRIRTLVTIVHYVNLKILTQLMNNYENDYILYR